MTRDILQQSSWVLAFFALMFLVARLFVVGGDAPLSEGRANGVIPADPFEEVALSAKAAFVYDIAEKEVLFERHGEAQIPLASLAKLMTTAVAARALPTGAEVIVTKDAVSEEGDTGLLVGERWRAEDLAALTLLASSNDGAAALASAAVADAPVSFNEQMNDAAQTLGLTQTYFINETGLDAGERVAGAYGSARDVALLLSYLLKEKPAILSATPYAKYSFVSLDKEAHDVENTHESIEALPAVVASKTGFTDLAGGNLTVVFEAAPMHPIVVVVLGSTIDERFTDVEKLVWGAIEFLQK